jgi:hypothetical protein
MIGKLGAEGERQMSENRTIQLWNQLPADALGSLSSKSSNFRKRVRKVINRAK